MLRGKRRSTQGNHYVHAMKKENRPNQLERRETVQDGDTEADGGLHPDNVVSLHMSDEQISILAEKIARAIPAKITPTLDPSNRPETQQQQPHVSYQNELPTSGIEEDTQEEELKQDLKYYFMDPYMKFKISENISWKLLVQIFKLILISIQLVMFGEGRTKFIEYVENNNIAMKHMFLMHWKPVFETMPYPPATGPYAIYTSNHLVDHINFAMKQFNETENLSLGSVKYTDKKYLHMCVEQYSRGDFLKNGTSSLDQNVIKDCLYLKPVHVYNTVTNTTEPNFDIMAILERNQKKLVYDRILKIELKYSLKSIRLSMEKTVHEPECYRITGRVVFDGTMRDGRMLVNLFSSMKEFKCSVENSDISENDANIHRIVLDVLVIILCLASYCMHIKWHCHSIALLKRTVKFFKTSNTRNELTLYEKFEFINLWFVLILINDILFVVGSIFKILLEKKHAESSSENYDICALMLGSGSLFAYIGAIRYIGFFKTFNIVTKVLKNAFPDMMRFLLTTILLFWGFLFCGWAVLGPYHIKFRHLSTASECLFSLLNGDEMFTTFSATVTDNTAVWYFSRFYLYIFTGLFIYAVLNLFVAVILDTYEKFKKNQLKSQSNLQTFIDECTILDQTRYQGEVKKNLGKAWSFLCESFEDLQSWYNRKRNNPRMEFHNLEETI